MTTAIGLAVLATPTVVGARGRYSDIAETTAGSVGATTDGDLAGCTAGAALVARVQRMFRNPSGAYAHLGAWGSAIAAKTAARQSALAAYQIQARATLEADPDIRSATVTLTPVAGARGVWLLDVRIVDRFGNPDGFTTTLGG